MVVERETYHPELNFVKKELHQLIKPRNVVIFPGITFSFIFNKQRNFPEDVEKIAKCLDAPVVKGGENIPLCDNSPLIIACNHPRLTDLVLGVVLISNTFDLLRKEKSLPGNIHWFITENIPTRGLVEKKRTILTLKGLNWILPRLIRSYQFIGIPSADRKNQTLKRAGGLLTARRYLKEDSPSRVIGIFPEGDAESGEELQEFFQGVGQLVKLTKDDALRVLPVRIYRDKVKRLNVSFGETIQPDYSRKAREITNQIREAISQLDFTKNPIT